MPTKFTTSVNIIRDKGKDLNYIPTPNAIRIVDQIANDFKKGIRSFSIIGSYGTGKSSFLWAFQESILKHKKHFGINLLPNPTVEFVDIVGEYKSIKEVFADLFEIKNDKFLSENIFSEIFNKYHDLGKKNPILFIVIDEFGKFLEYAAQNQPEKELYFIQQLAEFVNNPDSNIILFTTVHQNFDAYSLSLTQAQKQEWTKVKGRFREITFNEPVEQLLFLASEHLNKKPSTDKASKSIGSSVDLLIKSKAFDVNEDYIKNIQEKLYPLDAISSYTLTLSLQKYGQNERSLFSFLESTDHTGLFQHAQNKQGFFTLAEVYDYLIFNFYSFLNSRYNPDFGAWRSIKASLEKVETAFDSNLTCYSKIIKTIGLLNINAKAGAVLDEAFLLKYAEKCLDIKNAAILIKDLVSKKIILFRNYSKRFILFGGTDLDIPTALIQAGAKIDDVTDVVTLLNKYYQLPPIAAKRVMFKTGTPRLFEYKISSFPINEIPRGEIDGFINLIFNEKNILSNVKEHSKQNDEAILYCYYKNSKSIKDLLFEIEKTKKVIGENEEDKVAVKELQNIILHQQNLLTHKIINNFYGTKSDVVWIFKGEVVAIKNKKEFNNKLSSICEEVYIKSPIFINELVNKHKISSSIHTAKRSFFKALVNHWNKPQLGFAAEKFPPEKTIYLSLLEQNNIKLFTNEVEVDITPSSNNHFDELWKLSCKFLDSAKISKRKITEFIELLGERPFKLKQGVIDFWVPSFLFIKREEYALFGDKGYIPFITDEVLDLMLKKPHEFEVKTFAFEGVKLDLFNSYRIFLEQNTKHKLTNASFIETIKPFLTFYKTLPEYSKNTMRLSDEAKSVRKAIATSKDPEQTFFEDFPTALGFSISQIQLSNEQLQQYIIKLQSAIKELRNCFDELVNRTEQVVSDIIGEEISFEKYKESLQIRFKDLRRHLLLPTQKVFVQRLDSKIDDKKAWLNSLVQALVERTLDKINDEDEILIYDKFKSMILNLDSLTILSTSDFAEEKEEVFDLQINSFAGGMINKLVRLPKNKQKQIQSIQTALRKDLSNDPSLNIAALTNLLKEYLNNG